MITLKNEYFFLIGWFPAPPVRDDWFGNDGVLPAEIVFLSQDEAEVAGEPNGDTQDVEPGSDKYIPRRNGYLKSYIYIYIYNKVNAIFVTSKFINICMIYLFFVVENRPFPNVAFLLLGVK